MYAKCLDIDNFVKINSLKEITDPIYLQGGRPSVKGLFSYDIFGITPADRVCIWAYIDLGARFLNPLAFINLKRYNRKMEYLISGTKTFIFKDGDFIEDKNGETGIDFLYENYDNIKWKEPSTIFPAERVKFLKQPKDNIFITKYPVTPPFYRDISNDSQMGVDEINGFYKKLIQQSSTLKKRSASFSMFSHMTRFNIQTTINAIFDYLVFKGYSGKYGVMKQAVLGTTVDRGVRLVISAPKIEGSNRYTDMSTNFKQTGCPLASCIAMGWDYVLKATKDFFDNEFVRGGKYSYRAEDGTITKLTLIRPEIEYSDEYIKHKMEQFVQGPSTRFEEIPIPENKEGVKAYLAVVGRFGKASEHISARRATWTDIFYMICKREFEDKKMHIEVTRYPVEDYNGIFYSGIRVTSTTETVRAMIGDDVYEHYPVCVPGGDSSNSFAETLVISNVYLKGIGGD